jgi:8-oxo-dGTP pyrophosphatase MutT (NUDIX family)
VKLRLKSVEIFRTRKPKIIGKRREYSVMLLLTEIDGELHLILEKRARTLKSQPGDICLPGGGIEAMETPLEAAIRETMEELRIKREEMEIIGPMDYFLSPYGQTMYPFVARTTRTEFEPSRDEVERLIFVPLSFFEEHVPLIYEIDLTAKLGEDFPYHLIENGKDYPFRRATNKQYFYKFGDTVIWGFTAQIVKSFIDILKEEDEHAEF